MIHDHQHGVEVPFFGQVCDKIPTDHLKGVGMCLRGHNRIDWDFGPYCVWFGALTDSIPLHILNDKSFHIWPPIIPRHTCICVKDPWMSCTFVVMIHAKNTLLQCQIIGDHWSGSFEPMVIDGCKSMVFCPLLDLWGSSLLLIIHFLLDVEGYDHIGEQFIRQHLHILIILFPFIIVWSSRQVICFIGRSWLVY
jgi:hypothetical protein